MSESFKAATEHQFENFAQQEEAARLGMWTFLATEVMFFGGLFMAYIVYRHEYPHAFAVASKHTDLFYGTLNTAILLTSSLWMALAVNAAKENRRRQLVTFLLLTILFALGFLGVKALEYSADLRQHLLPGKGFSVPEAPKTDMFFFLYWAMTGLHGLHVLIGIGVLSVIALLAHRGKFTSENHNAVEVSGLYWHFVDIVWIFLYPLLYLVDRHV
jgi:cytochrome c oxidase subunit III